MQEEIINILNNKDKSYTITEINDLLGLTTIEEYQTLQNTLEDLCSNGIVYYSEKKIFQKVMQKLNLKVVLF